MRNLVDHWPPQGSWDTAQLRATVSVAGKIIDERIHRQENGGLMKFISICDNSGIIECELFADVYRRFGTETVRHPLIEITGKVVPFANGRGHTLRVLRVGAARGLVRQAAEKR